MLSKKIRLIVLSGAVTGAVLAFGCGTGRFGDDHTWKRPCGTAAQREADSQACIGASAGIADPSVGSGAEYAQDLFRECMESRGWQRVPSSTTLQCE